MVLRRRQKRVFTSLTPNADAVVPSVTAADVTASAAAVVTTSAAADVTSTALMRFVVDIVVYAIFWGGD